MLLALARGCQLGRAGADLGTFRRLCGENRLERILSVQTGACVGLTLSFTACAPIAADAGIQPNSRVLLAQACTTSSRAFCESAEIACLRDCSDITRCVRKCCEAYQDCLTSHACEIRGSACPK
jgi:hypothetical protein